MRKNLGFGILLVVIVAYFEAQLAKFIISKENADLDLITVPKKDSSKNKSKVNIVSLGTQISKSKVKGSFKTMEKIKSLFLEHQSLTTKKIKTLLKSKSMRTIRRYLDKLEATGFISQKGNTRSAIYVLNSQ